MISNTNGSRKGKKRQNDLRCNMLARVNLEDEGISRQVATPGLTARPVKSDIVSTTACHHSNVSSELRSPCAKLQRWTPPLVTRFGVTPRVLTKISFLIYSI